MDNPPHSHTGLNGTIKVLVVDDDLYVRSHLSRALSRVGGLSILGAVSAAEAAETAAAEPPDVVLIDISMRGIDGVETIRRIRELSPQTRVLALTSLPDQATAAGVRMGGASGCLAKDIPVAALASAIGTVHQCLLVMSPNASQEPPPGVPTGLADLGRNQTRILRLLCEGLTNAQIADRVQLSTSTVKRNVSQLMARLKAPNRTTLAIMAGPYVQPRT